MKVDGPSDGNLGWTDASQLGANLGPKEGVDEQSSLSKCTSDSVRSTLSFIRSIRPCIGCLDNFFPEGETPVSRVHGDIDM